MSLLAALWVLAATLIGLSLTAPLMIAAARVLRRRQREIAARVRAKLLGALTCVETHRSCLNRLIRQARGETLAAIVLQIAATIRGNLRDAFFERLIAAGAIEALSLQLRDGARMERVRAAEALSVISSGEAKRYLRLAWSDRSPRVRFAALQASVECGDGPPFEHALTMAIAAAGKKRVAAEHLLRRSAAARPREAVDWMRRVELSPALCRCVVEGLAESDARDDVIEILRSFVAHADADVRASAIGALAIHRAAAAAPEIMLALKDPVWTVRVRAISAAGKLRLHAATPLLVALLDDPEWWVRHRARHAMMLCGHEDIGMAI